MEEMSLNKKLIITLGLIILVGAGLGYLYILKKPNTVQNPGGKATTTVNIGGVDVDVVGPGGFTIEPIDLPPPPKFPRKITYPASFSDEARAIMEKKISDDVALLKGNISNAEAWIDLGLRYKQLEDYQGAKEAWEYASLLSPGNIVSPNNLGDLYHYYFNDYPKAEKNFRQAITNDPKYVLSYIGLHDLYRLSYGVLTTKAVDILKEGIAANPENIDLYMALASYYKNQNNKIDNANARVYYEKALAKARIAGNQSLVDAISAELDALK